MATTTVGNFYYIDSGGVNLDPFPMKVKSIAVAMTNTTSFIQLALVSNTAQIVYQQRCPDGNAVTLSTFFGGVWFNERLNVKTLTACTAWIYFE